MTGIWSVNEEEPELRAGKKVRNGPDSHGVDERTTVFDHGIIGHACSEHLGHARPCGQLILNRPTCWLIMAPFKFEQAE